MAGEVLNFARRSRRDQSVTRTYAPPCSVTHSRLPPRAAACSRSQSVAVACSRLQSRAVACSHLQPLADTHSGPRLLAVTRCCAVVRRHGYMPHVYRSLSQSIVLRYSAFTRSRFRLLSVARSRSLSRAADSTCPRSHAGLCSQAEPREIACTRVQSRAITGSHTQLRAAYRPAVTRNRLQSDALPCSRVELRADACSRL